MLLETIPVTDPLTSNESGYYEKGNWTKMSWATSAPSPSASGASLGGFGTQTGSYDNAFSIVGTNQAVSIKRSIGSDIAERFWELWLCLNPSTHSGFRALWTLTSTTEFTPKVFSVSSGTETLLITGTAVVAEAGDLFGFLKEGTAIKAYYKHPSGAWTVNGSTTSSAFTTGNTGFGGQGADPFFTEFRTSQEITGKIWPPRVRLQANARASTI